MATIEQFKDKAVDAAQIAARAARHVAFMTKKHMEIACEQEKIHRNYARLGKVYYKDYVTDEEPDEAEYQPICEAISESFQRINDLREMMEEEKADYSGVPAEKAEKDPENPSACEDPEEENETASTEAEAGEDAGEQE